MVRPVGANKKVKCPFCKKEFTVALTPEDRALGMFKNPIDLVNDPNRKFSVIYKPGCEPREEDDDDDLGND